MKTVSGAMYKDATTADFSHYFQGCAMLLKIPTDKRRLYIVEGVAPGPVINGSYLTRNHEWKEKNLRFNDWYENLDVILPHAHYFNVGKAAAYWIPPVNRNNGGLKKAFMYQTSRVTLLGKPSAEEATEQNVAACAFGDVYGHTATLSGDAVLRSDRTASHIRGDFLFDHVSGKAYYRHTPIGSVADGVVSLFNKKKVFRDLLINDGGISARNVTILPEIKEEVKQEVPVANMAPPPTNWDMNVNQQQQVAGAWNIGTTVFGGALGTIGAFAQQHQNQQTAIPAGAQPGFLTTNRLAGVPHYMNTVNTDPTLPDSHLQNRNHVPRSKLGTDLHRGAPDNTTEPGWKLNAYGAFPSASWRRPLWGRGWAYMHGDVVVNVRGLFNPAAKPQGVHMVATWGYDGP